MKGDVEMEQVDKSASQGSSFRSGLPRIAKIGRALLRQGTGVLHLGGLACKNLSFYIFHYCR